MKEHKCILQSKSSFGAPTEKAFLVQKKNNDQSRKTFLGQLKVKEIIIPLHTKRPNKNTKTTPSRTDSSNFFSYIYSLHQNYQHSED